MSRNALEAVLLRFSPMTEAAVAGFSPIVEKVTRLSVRSHVLTRKCLVAVSPSIFF